MNRIYVACLSAYNNGFLHGEWIEIDGLDKEEVMQEISALLITSPVANLEACEEWAIHDSEGFEGFKVGEWHDIGELVEYCEVMENCDHDIDMITGVMDNRGCTISEAIEYCDDNYSGDYKDLGYWAEDFLYGEVKLSKELMYYFDFDGYGEAQDLSGYIFTVPSLTGMHVFWNS